eukprot:Amastigsp_a185319_37.p6 type:complete len:104 gc:universal Amastigsp_a185319_37:1341-1030(-)
MYSRTRLKIASRTGSDEGSKIRSRIWSALRNIFAAASCSPHCECSSAVLNIESATALDSGPNALLLRSIARARTTLAFLKSPCFTWHTATLLSAEQMSPESAP